MNTRQKLLDVIGQLPDEQLASLLKVAQSLQTNQSAIDLQSRGIDEVQAADLRVRLSQFAEDWNSPEMDVYDNYDVHSN
jgi:hypothetical protein